MLFRRRKNHPKHKPFDESKLPQRSFLSEAEATEEGLMLTEYASRMVVKNRFIKKILADKRPWFIEQSREDARVALERLASESDTEAKNLSALITRFQDNPDSGKDAQGYSYDDIANMQHRREVALEVARRLRIQRRDETYLTELVDGARRDAWREIAANIENNLDIEYFPIDEEYERNRDDRLRAFVDEDLAKLLAQPRPERQPDEHPDEHSGAQPDAQPAI